MEWQTGNLAPEKTVAASGEARMLQSCLAARQVPIGTPAKQ